jgi:ATP-binding cassette subfamily B protein
VFPKKDLYLKMKTFPHYTQLDTMDCGPTCLRMVAKYYGKNYSLETLREKSYITREGVSLLGTSEAAESIGFRTIGLKITFEQLINEAPLPCIAHWKQEHFVVIHKITKIKNSYNIYIADPAEGIVKLSDKEFKKAWLSTKENGEEKGVCLLLETTPDFYAEDGEKHKKASFGFLFKYLKPYKKFLTQLFLGF